MSCRHHKGLVALSEAVSLYPSLLLHMWGYQPVLSLHSNRRSQHICLHFYRFDTSEISLPLFFFSYNKSQNKEIKHLLRKLGIMQNIMQMGKDFHSLCQFEQSSAFLQG